MPTDLIEGYAAYLRSQSSSPNTIRDRRRVLAILDRDLPQGLEMACSDELNQWLWRDGLSAGSRETYFGAISGFYGWCVLVGHFDWSPASEMTRPKVPRRLPKPCTDEELASILTRAVEPYRTWALIAAYSGARCIEISRLRREHVTERTMSLLGKGDKPRVVPTHPEVWAVVRDLPPGPITEHDERWISIRTAVYFRRKLAMPGMSLHRLRHWFGTMVQRLHRDLRVTQELMGHADPATTAGYALVADEDARTAVLLLPSVVGPDGGGRQEDPALVR